MVIIRACQGHNQRGEHCRQSPLQESAFCFWHDPDHAKEAAEARRLGGVRRRREHTLRGAYDLEGLTTVPAIRRLLDIAAVDVLALENSVGRVRTLVAVAMAASKLLETGELEERMEALEATIKHREPPIPIFGAEDA